MRLLLTLALCAAVMNPSALAAAGQADITHLRPQDARLKQVIRSGASRSATFKALVDRVESSDVILYVALNSQMRSNLSGMLTWMTWAGSVRYLRASISPELAPDQMIATIAHELQHAVEVIEDDTVNDEHSLVALYRRIGRQSGTSSPSRWETDAAQQTAFRVRRELADGPVTMSVRSGAAGRW